MKATFILPGVFALAETEGHELAGRSVRGLTAAPRREALALVDGHTIQRRSASRAWTVIAESDRSLSCLVAIGEVVCAGTDDARILELRGAKLVELTDFGAVEGRDTWYAGQALVDGRMLGPPLGVRSITATSDGATRLANVHVGGIPRSTDGGVTWHATIDIEADVHEVRAHPTRPELVAAAAAFGVWVSGDGGASWSVVSEGFHAPHAAGVAFVGDDVLVSASVDPFSREGALYRLASGAAAVTRVRGGLPDWLDGKVDTSCIATKGDGTVAIADMGGSVYVSRDGGATWSRLATGLPAPSGVLLV